MRELLTDIIPSSSCDIEADDLEKEILNQSILHINTIYLIIFKINY